ncbi:proton-coupled amino acid transporter-like protein pathetic isoform X2 [Manduca sexta]|uniref:Amino acid transporter transmembrane domain-containing protein n=1 Tax=Manduca sexta TaxID=7130 RepID=A0A921YRN1_MANSE|nr:proton-coupled amino acid transporter-like protein pathetic isoform X2 [Manduca sexta]KAG6444090.1 hypothetical protein O3G_MSEX003202 [Manduca sexta]
MATPKPSTGGPGNFTVIAQSEEEEEAFNYVQFRHGVKFTSVTGSVAHIVKGALGGGILSGHVAYMKAGVKVAVPLNVLFGFYMGYCLHLLVQSAQTLYKRTRIPSMSYADVGEAALACCPNRRLARFAKVFRHMIDVIICIDLFGACACYHLIIGKSLKQLVENTIETSMEPLHPGYPSLRVYMACMIVPIICICLILHLKWLAPFSLAANMTIVFCIIMAIYYAFEYNPNFENLVGHTSLYHYLEFVGMTVFSMSCAGVVIPIENNMREPKKFPLALTIGMSLIVICTFLVSFFGYAGFLEKSEAPITVNFPMTVVALIFKYAVIIMIYITHALNFWPPFNLVFHYLKKRHSPERIVLWELLYRAIFVIIIGIVAIIFPNINALMGFLGTFCLSNMAFIWPNVINLLVIWERPGFGQYYWKLWRSIVFILVGIFILFCGSLVNIMELLTVFY